MATGNKHMRAYLELCQVWYSHKSWGFQGTWFSRTGHSTVMYGWLLRACLPSLKLPKPGALAADHTHGPGWEAHTTHSSSCFHGWYPPRFSKELRVPLVSAEGISPAGWMLSRPSSSCCSESVSVPAKAAGTEGWDWTGCQACGAPRPREEGGQGRVRAGSQQHSNCFLLFHRYEARDDGTVSHFGCVV